jgi:hypothetical protein
MDTNVRNDIEPLLVKHPDAQRLIACGASKYWELVRAREIEVVGEGAMGRAYESLKRYVARLQAKAAEKAA